MNNVVALAPSQIGRHKASQHVVHFYDNDAVLVEAVKDFLAVGLKAGRPCIVIGTEDHRQAFCIALAASGIDLETALGSEQLCFFDARETLGKFMVHDAPDEGRFRSAVLGMIGQALGSNDQDRIHLFGEMVDLLWRDGNRPAALRLEELWNGLARECHFSLLCGYACGNFYKASDTAPFEQICDLHESVVRPQDPRRANDAEAQSRELALLEQRALALEHEVEQRRELEESLRMALLERRHAEDALRTNQRLLETITDMLPVLVSYIDADRRYRFANGTYERWFGRTKSEVVGKHLTDVLGRDAYASLRPHLEAAFSGVAISYQVEMPYRHGGARFIEATYVPDFAPDGTVQGVTAMITDISERKRLEDERLRLQLDNQRARLRAELLHGLAKAIIVAERVEQVFDAALDSIERSLDTPRASILVFDRDGVMRFKAWRGLSEEYRTAVEGHSPWTRDERSPQPIVVSNVENDPGLRQYLPLFESEGIGSLAFFPLVAAGRVVGKFMVYYAEPRELLAQEVDTALAIANHVAVGLARFAAIDELRETVRFNEMFTGILGHDLRNPLGAIMTAAELALKRGENDRLVRPLSRIVTSGHRMARMIDQLLDFTRVRVGEGIPLAPGMMNLSDVIRQVMDELDDAHPGWSLRLEQEGDATGVWDEDRLSQVFSNLVANALQHGAKDAGVTVRIDGTRMDRVRVEVHNVGCIPADDLPRLFEPMTGGPRRDKSQGLGLGLFISQQILKAHGGRIDARSGETGTTFTVSLPRKAPK